MSQQNESLRRVLMLAALSVFGSISLAHAQSLRPLPHAIRAPGPGARQRRDGGTNQ